MKDRKLNAIPPRRPETADERTARQLRLCAELADLAMQLARLAAAKALAAEPVEAPSPETPVDNKTPEPPSAPARAAGATHRAASCKPVDPAQIFIRCAAVVKSCITLELRITAGGTPPTPRAAARPSSADPRRTTLRETFRHLTIRNPAQAARLPEINAHLDQHLAADPDQTLNLADIFTAICEDLALEIDFATLPDQYLDLLCEPPDPHATSPPT